MSLSAHENKMASEEKNILGAKCIHHQGTEYALTSDDHYPTEWSLDSDTGMSNVERLLMDLRNKIDRQDEKLDIIQTSFSGLEDRVCKKLCTQDEKLDNIKISFNGLEDRVCKRLDQEKGLMRDRLSDAMKLILVRLHEGTHKIGVAASQRSNENTQDQFRPKDVTDTIKDSESRGIQSMKYMLQAHGQTLLDGVTAQVTSGLSSLRDETVQTLEREKHELLTEKDFFKGQLYKAMADVSVHVQDIKTCVRQDRDDVSWNFDLDKTEITLDDVKNAVNTSKEETAQELAKLKDAFVQELRSNKESQTLTIIAKIETSAQDVVEELHSDVKQLKETVEETEDGIKQEITNLEISTQTTIDRFSKGIAADLSKTRDAIVTEVQKAKKICIMS